MLKYQPSIQVANYSDSMVLVGMVRLKSPEYVQFSENALILSKKALVRNPIHVATLTDVNINRNYDY